MTANIRIVDKVTWLNGVVAKDGPFDMYIGDLAALLVIDQNLYLSGTTAAWNSARQTDSKVDEFYARYASRILRSASRSRRSSRSSRWTSSTGTRSPGHPSTRSPSCLAVDFVYTFLDPRIRYA